VLARVLKTEIREFPSVFQCSRVLNLAINAHEILCFQLHGWTVTAEGGGNQSDSQRENTILSAMKAARRNAVLSECIIADALIEPIWMSDSA
jgi:hypothetical protein